MFLYLSDELDFKQLSQMAQEVENFSKKASMTEKADCDAGHRSLNITDMYGFIRERNLPALSQNLDENEGDDFGQRIVDRCLADNLNHPIKHRKQEKLGDCRQSVTQFGQFVKGSLKVRPSEQP